MLDRLNIRGPAESVRQELSDRGVLRGRLIQPCRDRNISPASCRRSQPPAQERRILHSPSLPGSRRRRSRLGGRLLPARHCDPDERCLARPRFLSAGSLTRESSTTSRRRRVVRASTSLRFRLPPKALTNPTAPARASPGVRGSAGDRFSRRLQGRLRAAGRCHIELSDREAGTLPLSKRCVPGVSAC